MGWEEKRREGMGRHHLLHPIPPAPWCQRSLPSHSTAIGAPPLPPTSSSSFSTFSTPTTVVVTRAVAMLSSLVDATEDEFCSALVGLRQCVAMGVALERVRRAGGEDGAAVERLLVGAVMVGGSAGNITTATRLGVALAESLTKARLLLSHTSHAPESQELFLELEGFSSGGREATSPIKDLSLRLGGRVWTQRVSHTSKFFFSKGGGGVTP